MKETIYRTALEDIIREYTNIDPQDQSLAEKEILMIAQQALDEAAKQTETEVNEYFKVDYRRSTRSQAIMTHTNRNRSGALDFMRQTIDTGGKVIKFTRVVEHNIQL